MAVQYGQQITDAWTAVDTALAVNAGATVNGGSMNIGANTDPQAVVVRLQLGLTNNAGVPSEGYDMDIIVQHSRDNATWPDNGEGQSLGNWYSAVVGAGITRSRYIEFQPMDRYSRLQYTSGCAADQYLVTMTAKQVFMQAG
jgi:hypothetical protein